MALGRQGERQTELMVGWAELPRSPGHAFYDRLQAVLVEAGFDGFAEGQCARRLRRQAGPAVAAAGPLLPDASGRLLRGDPQRARPGMALRRQPVACASFCGWARPSAVPDHSWLSKTRSRLPLEVHEAIFDWVLQRLAEHGLIQGDRIGVDASTMEANAALRSDRPARQRRRLSRDAKRLAEESGIETPTAEDLIRLDRHPQGQAAVQRGLGLAERPGRQDRQDEGRPHPAGLQARACGRSGYRGHCGGRDPSCRSGRHHDPAGRRWRPLKPAWPG